MVCEVLPLRNDGRTATGVLGFRGRHFPRTACKVITEICCISSSRTSMSVKCSMRLTIMLDRWSSLVVPSSLSAMRSTKRKRSAATFSEVSDFEGCAIASHCFLGPLRPREGVTSSGSLRGTDAAALGILEVDAVAGATDSHLLLGLFSLGW